MQITNTLLGLTAMLLGASLLVQVLQELYKYLSSSKSRLYRQVLADAIGPIGARLFEAGPATRFHVRSPFQFFRSRPTGTVLPMDKGVLLSAMDAQVPDWAGYVLRAVRDEARIQGGVPSAPSPRLAGVMKAVAEKSPDAVGTSDLGDVRRFLDARGALEPSSTLDARRLLDEIYLEFIPERVRIDEEFDRIRENFEYAYVRRNTRQTLVLGFLLAVVVGLPFSGLYETASRLSPEEAAQAAVAMREAYDRLQPNAAEAMVALEKGSQELAEEFERIRDALPGKPGYDGWKRLGDLVSPSAWGALLGYLGNCMLTAILIGFGAPFWHRLTGALLRVAKPEPPVTAQEA